MAAVLTISISPGILKGVKTLRTQRFLRVYTLHAEYFIFKSKPALFACPNLNYFLEKQLCKLYGEEVVCDFIKNLCFTNTSQG